MGRNQTVYVGYPKQLTCTKTGKVVKCNPVQIKKALEKKGIDLQTYISTFVCRDAKHSQPCNTPTTPTTPVQNSTQSSKEQRKDVIKKLWKKVCENSPEYYRETFNNIC
jgi:hypothetical protein